MAVSDFRFGRASRVLGSDRGGGASRWRTVVVVAVAAAVLFVSAAPAPAEAPVGVEDPGVLWDAQGSLVAGPGSVLVGSGDTAVVSETSTQSGAAQVVAGSGGAPEAAVQSSGGWWDGTAVLATNAPVFVEQGSCSSFGDGGSFGLLAGGPLSKVCAEGGLSGLVRGVGWFEGFDSDGSFVAVELVGAPGLAEGVYQGLGSVDVVFDGGTFTADFTECEHQTESTFSSCRAVVAEASLPPGPLVGVATAGTEPPSRSVRSTDDPVVTPAAERAALVALYNATNGANWFRNTNWNTSAAVSTWYGVTTNDSGSVTHVYMFSNGLVGPLPSQIGDLTNLTSLRLSQNRLSGSIPVELGGLTNLTDLSLGHNGLSGSIPVELGGLTNVTGLYLQHNSLSGSIPTELGNLANLTDLSLHDNGLSGSIPTELGGLTNLTGLYLSANGLSGSIPTELGNLTNLTSLWLHGNGLSGSIPIELGNLTNLEILLLGSNGLSGSVPIELGNLTNLEILDFDNNHISGCVPFALSTVRFVRFDLSLGYCGVTTVTPTWSRARESDAVALFTLAAVAPGGTGSGGSVVTVDYTAVADSRAVAGSDFTATSGTVTIPAGNRYVTVSVPLVNDSIVERDEYFGLLLSNPVGAVLTGTSVLATIVDDDRGLPDRFVPVGVCADGAVEGSVTDVFEQTQAGFNQWHQVFVDVDLDCGGRLTSGVGFPIAVSVIHGPAASVGLSGHCVIQTDSVKVTASRATSGGCRTFAAPVPSQLSQSGRSTHVLRIPDSAVGEAHQIRVWVDYDGDGVHDGGEPYEIFENNFVSRRRTDSGSMVFEYPRNFEVQLVGGSTRVARAGLDSVQYLRLVEPSQEFVRRLGSEPLPVTVYTPVANAPVGAVIAVGPSDGQVVYCFDTPEASPRPPSDRNACFTDHNGEIIVRYRVPGDAVDLFSMQQDLLRVFIDADRDGVFDIGPFFVPLEPVAYVQLPIAKAVNYVALGDSYSSGEVGAKPPQGTAYQTGVSPADGECRRWNQAYPYVFAREVLNIDNRRMNVRFATFACTGATTHNIYDPADPNPTPLLSFSDYGGDNRPPTAHDTDRPSGSAALGRPLFRGQPFPGLVYVRSPRWEPRQAVSLQTKQTKLAAMMRNVDMITITIGGNDAGFADVLKECVDPLTFDHRCDESDVDADLERVGDQIAVVITQLRIAAPDASIFVLGYPYLTPDVGGCADPQVTYELGHYSWDGETTLTHASPECEFLYNLINDCPALVAEEVVNLSYGGAAGLFQFVTGLYADSVEPAGRISFGEARFLSEQAEKLDVQIREAATQSGAHFVDSGGFLGHSPCDPVAWLDGFMAEGLSAGSAASGRSFHPNEAGHRGYANILEQYIRTVVKAANVELNEAGLPINPSPQSGSSNTRSTTGSVSAKETVDGPRQSTMSTTTPSPSAGHLAAQRVVDVAQCASPFASPDEQVRLVTDGFAPSAAVAFAVEGVTIGGGQVTVPALAATTADADGAISVLWSVPTAPAATVDATPRAYMLFASGLNPDGGTHTAHMIQPIVAYPATPPCATADTATTTLGQAVDITVLTNDTAPTGGALDASTVRVLGYSDGGFTVNSATGVITYTPEPGFYGTASGTYVVFDGWGVGVKADITVTVASGCTITGTAGVTTITGTAGDDVICVPDPDDRRAFHVIEGLGGDDVIVGGAGVEWIYGDSGDDTIYGREGDDRMVAGPGNDTVYGGEGVDHVYSVDLVDTIVDDSYVMVLTPQAAVTSTPPVVNDDWAWVDTSATVEVDVLGNDHDPNENLDPSTLTVTRQPTVGTATVATTSDGRTVIEYAAATSGGTTTFAYQVCDTLGGCSTAEVTVMVGTTGCTIVGTAGDDTLLGTAGDDVICGLGGNDVIYGLGGNDIIIGGDGDDTLYGGDATLIGVTDGDDLLWGGAGDDTLYGGNGKDTLWGGPGDDSLAGNRRDDLLFGGAGDDTIVGGGENDVIYGGAGNDILDGHAHDDTIYGGSGNDMVRGGNGDDVLWGDAGDDTLTGGTGRDTLYGGPGTDVLDGNTQNDMLWGGTGNDILNGQGHDDQLHGGAGDDTLNGGYHDDRVYGGAGDDTLDGGDGTDHLDGGPDVDSCRRGNTASRCESEVRL